MATLHARMVRFCNRRLSLQSVLLAPPHSNMNRRTSDELRSRAKGRGHIFVLYPWRRESPSGESPFYTLGCYLGEKRGREEKQKIAHKKRTRLPQDLLFNLPVKDKIEQPFRPYLSPSVNLLPRKSNWRKKPVHRTPSLLRDIDQPVKAG